MTRATTRPTRLSLLVTKAASRAFVKRLCPQVRRERRTGPIKAEYKDRTAGGGPVTALRTDVCVEAVMNVRRERVSACRWILPMASSALVLTACAPAADPQVTQASSPAPSSNSASTSTSTSTSDPASPVGAAALAAYDGFWAAKVVSQADPTKTPPKSLETFSTDKALAEALATVLILRRNKIHMVGTPTHTVRVVRVEPSDPTVVTLTDCLDSTAWIPVFVTSGQSALAPGQSPRVVVESLATQYAGRWVIKSSIAYRDRSC